GTVKQPLADLAHGLEAASDDATDEIDDAVDEAERRDAEEGHDGADKNRQEDQLDEDGQGRAAEKALKRAVRHGPILRLPWPSFALDQGRPRVVSSHRHLPALCVCGHAAAPFTTWTIPSSRARSRCSILASSIPMPSTQRRRPSTPTVSPGSRARPTSGAPHPPWCARTAPRGSAPFRRLRRARGPGPSPPSGRAGRSPCASSRPR